MTPKEKSQELFDKYWELNTDFDGLVKYELAKQCALIAVDELIKYVMPDNSFPGYNEWFWQEVKQEIENL
jgi:hypothetical protein